MMGAIFVIAETGTFAVCTNEGNADLSANVPKLQIASIGVEKIISRLEHLAVFIRLLSRSALGSPITQRGPRATTSGTVSWWAGCSRSFTDTPVAEMRQRLNIPSTIVSKTCIS
jgi:hypothetical protein